MDEIRQTSYYPNSFVEIIDNAASQSQPPLDYWIGHFVHLISSGDFAVRLPAAIFGTGSVILLVMLISQVCSWPVACTFGIIAAFLPFNLYYSQEARPYAIAVFLFQCIYWALNRFLSTPIKKRLLAVLMLFFFSTIFLYSRSLSPLVITVSLLIILFGWLFIRFLKADFSLATTKQVILLSCGSLILALVIYFPSLRFILAKSSRYVSDTSVGLPIDKILSTVIKLDLAPIWQAYAVQSEPITYPLLALVCLSPLLGWKLYLHRKNSVWGMTSILLPLVCTLNLIIFQLKTNMPFRPAYASYLLPLVCILAAISIQGLWTLSVKVPFAQIARSFVIILAAWLTFQTLVSAVEYKKLRRKSDWRGAAAFLAAKYDARHLLIFDSFARYGSWEPTFYGFPRYYNGSSPIASIARTPLLAPQMAASSLTPILILFQWREYFLTSQSPYPILPVSSHAPVANDYQRICQDPELICTEFTGFNIIQLRETSESLADDTYDIIQRLLLYAPQGSWNVELHLAAAALARTTEQQRWHDHLVQAEKMIGEKQLSKQVRDIAAHIREIKPP